MFSTPEVQRLVSGDNAEIDLDDLKYVTFQTSLMRTKFSLFSRSATTTVLLIVTEVSSANVSRRFPSSVLSGQLILVLFHSLSQEAHCLLWRFSQQPSSHHLAVGHPVQRFQR